MRREETEVLVVQVASYLNEILELRVIAGTKAFDEGFGDDRRQASSKEHCEYSAPHADSYLRHAVMILDDQNGK